MCKKKGKVMNKNTIIQIILFLLLLTCTLYSQTSTIWSKCYNKDIRDEAYFITTTSDSGCIITGMADGDRTYDLYVLKINSSGDTLWSRSIGGIQTQERGFCIRQTTDSCFIVTGFLEDSGYNIFLLKLNSAGETLWLRTYGKGVANSVIQTSDNCYLIAADRDTLSNRYACLIKTDTDGNVIWSKEYDITSPITFCVMETTEKNYIIGCYGFSESESKNVEMYCADSLGNLKWQIVNDNYVSIRSVIELPGKYIVGVGSMDNHYDTDLRILKTNNIGNIIGEKEYNMDGHITGTDVELLNSDKLIISVNGEGYGDVIIKQWALLCMTNLNGDTLWTQILNDTKSDTQSGQLNSIAKISNNQLYGAGWFSASSDYNSDFWITKINIDTTVNGVNIKNESFTVESYFLEQNYPNPFNPATTIEYSLPEQADVKLMIYDIKGNTIKQWTYPNQNAGYYSVVWDGTNNSGNQVSTGIYFYRIIAGDFIQTKKMVFMK